MTEPPSLLLQLKLISLAVLSSNYWLYDFNATIFQKNFKVFHIFGLFVTCEIFHIILILIALIGLEKTFTGSQIKFLDKTLWFKWLQHLLHVVFYWIFGFCLYLLLFS